MSGVPVRWTGWPTAPAPVRDILRARRLDASARVVDDADRQLPWGAWPLLREVVRLGWLHTLDLLLATLVFVVTRRRSPPTSQPAADGDGPVVLVLPVLPDLSHTFVYREVLAVLRQRPDWRVVVLERNPRAPVHAEAAELAARATFLPRDGVTRRALRLLRWLGTAPGRDVFALYRAQPDGSPRDLLGKLPLRDARHPGNCFALADLLATMRPRALHVYSSTYAANVAMGAAMLLEVPWSISSYVDFEFAYAHKMLAEKLRRARFCRVVTAFCAARLRALPDLPPLAAEQAPVVYLGLDLANWREHTAAPGRGVLVSAARLVPKKGLQYVPAALAMLRARGIACRWRVIGDGPELADLRASCEQHGVAAEVDFLGPQDNQTVRRELLAADIALLPCVLAADGERDGIPIFLVEAMALGVPAVTTPVSGIPELVRDGDTGFLAAPGDSNSLAEVLAGVLGAPERARAVGQRGRDAVHHQLDVDDCARQLIGCIER